MTAVLDWWYGMRDDAFIWCSGKNWIWRLPIFLYGCYLAINHVFVSIITDYVTYPVEWLTVAIHELGHVLFTLFGETLHVAGGSITQLIVPVILIVSFLKQRDYFAISFGFAWLSYSLSDLSVYMADSRALQLPLVSLGGGGDTIHDWNYLFDKWGILDKDIAISGGVRFIAFLVAVLSVWIGAWVLYQMITHKEPLEADYTY